MKIAIISDTHFGYGWESRRAEDAFIQAQEAFEKAKDCDLILLPGDIFDERTPKPEVWSKTLKVLSIPLTSKKTGLRIVDSNISRKISPLVFSGIPVVAIHGTHERRSKSFVNPIQLLEKMGYVIHLHGEYVVFEKDVDGKKERVAVSGMSGVPEKFAPEVLRAMNFKKIENAYNILLFHQSVENYVYSDDEESVLKISDLPDNFDLIIDGHIHWFNITGQKNLVFPGSTVMTQMRKIEAEIPKGFLKVDTETGKIEFVKLKSARKFFYREINTEGLNSQQLTEKISSELEKILEDKFEKEPVVRFVLKGEKDLEIDMNHLKRIYGDKVILHIKKKITLSKKNYQYLQEFKKHRKSISEIGRELLEKNISEKFNKKINFDFYDLFELLAEGKNDLAFNKLMKYDIKS